MPQRHSMIASAKSGRSKTVSGRKPSALTGSIACCRATGLALLGDLIIRTDVESDKQTRIEHNSIIVYS